MSDERTDVPGAERDRRLILEAKAKGRLATLGAYTKLSGPGWLQSAITLGGGSLASSLYLGVLGGFALLWLQPVAMILGIVMLSTIAFVTLSTGERPFRAINRHVNPVLGWGWLIATMMANCVWSLPQFSLACAGVRQNLFPSVFGAMSANTANGMIAGAIAIVCIIVVYFYDSGTKGIKFFDILLKTMVGVIVISFFGVVVYMTGKGALNWGAIGGGFLPDIRLLWSPAATFDDALSAVSSEFRGFWSDKIVSEQQDVLVAAAATAVGINMTFLLPYSMLKRGWNKEFRGLAVFDLSTGLFVPFMMATGCVVIAAASRFHTVPAVRFPAEESARMISARLVPSEGNADQLAAQIEAILTEQYDTRLRSDIEPADFARSCARKIQLEAARESFKALDADRKEARLKLLLDDASAGKLLKPDEEDTELKKLRSRYLGLAAVRLKYEIGDEGFKKLNFERLQLSEKEKHINALPLADRRLAAMLVSRDAMHLAAALAPLTGDIIAHYVFGIGVVGMAVSSIIILMLINGFCITEMLGLESRGWPYRLGCLIPAVGLLGPFIWSGAAPYLAIPTSVFGFTLIPIAYTTFALLVNQRRLLGDNKPRGATRIVWNMLMVFTVLLVGVGSIYMVWKKAGWYGLAVVATFTLLALVVHFLRAGEQSA